MSLTVVRCFGVALASVTFACTAAPPNPAHRTFGTPEDAVRELTKVVKAGALDELVAIFGPEAKDLIASSDPATARRHREVFTVAVAERWRLEDQGPTSKALVIGNEGWPFPIPLAKVATGWRFDTAAGKEEVIARRIGRNELAAIRICRTYVAAQRLYADRGHDGQRAGIYARTFRSNPGRQNGLYWPAGRGQKRSPLGDLVAHAAEEGQTIGQDVAAPSPFHGYYFRILTAQGAAVSGGPKNYVVNGAMSDGFALVAWPAQYDSTGVMTFVVNQEGVVHEKDLGADTNLTTKAMTLYNPDSSWGRVQ